MAGYDIVLFDADNTLFDFDRAEAEALDWLTDHLGLPREAQARYLAINRALWRRCDLGEIRAEDLVVERFRQFFDACGVTGDPEAVNRAYLNKLGECPALLPGAEALCRTLAERCTLAIVTNGMASVQHSRMEQSPLKPYFKGLFISQEMGCRKPERRFFEQVFAGLGLTEADKPRAVVVGDNPLSDVKGGLDFGLAAVWYAPHGGELPDGIVPTCTARDYHEVMRFILAA